MITTITIQGTLTPIAIAMYCVVSSASLAKTNTVRVHTLCRNFAEQKKTTEKRYIFICAMDNEMHKSQNTEYN